MKITDQMCSQVWETISRTDFGSADSFTRHGRAAIEACAPILLGEPSEADCDLAGMQVVNEESGRQILVDFLGNRLRSLTQRPDALVRVIKMASTSFCADTPTMSDKYAEHIAAAIRAADKEAAC